MRAGLKEYEAMVARGIRRAVAVAFFGVVTIGGLITVGDGIAGAQAAPTLTTDAAQYSPGETVTFTGTNWGANCTEIYVFGVISGAKSGGTTVAKGIDPVNGSFTGTWEAANGGNDSYTNILLAQSLNDPTCRASTTFEVLAPPTSSTATTVVPTTTLPGATTTTAADATSADREIPRTGSDGRVLVLHAAFIVAAGATLLAAARSRRSS
jgi:hypothetical protein